MNPSFYLVQILKFNKPNASAKIFGNTNHPQLEGNIGFFDTPYGGILIEAEVWGLPHTKDSFYGMHIHEYGDCTPPFDQTGNHYNPDKKMHPMHAGDLPPLIGNQGYAWNAFYVTRFSISEVLGKSVVIHQNADDFTTQPSGASGNKIGCGKIQQAW